MNWKEINLHGSVAILRLCGEYVVEAGLRIPVSGYRIKVFERGDHFVARPNVRFRMPDGSVDGTSGLGATELDALQDAITGVADLLASRSRWTEADLDWVDPRDF